MFLLYRKKLFYDKGNFFYRNRRCNYCEWRKWVVRDGKPELQKIISSDVVKKTLELIEELGGGYQIIDWKNGYQNPYTHAMFEEQFKKKFDEPVEKVFKKKSMKTMAEIENNPILKIDATFDTVEAAERFMKELDPSLTFIPAGGYTSTFGAKAGEMMIKDVSKEICY